MVPVTTNQLGYPQKKTKNPLIPPLWPLAARLASRPTWATRSRTSAAVRMRNTVGNMWEDPMENLREKS